MNSQSQETFRRVTLNDPSLTILCLADNNAEYDGEFIQAAVAITLHLEQLLQTILIWKYWKFGHLPALH